MICAHQQILFEWSNRGE